MVQGVTLYRMQWFFHSGRSSAASRRARGMMGSLFHAGFALLHSSPGSPPHASHRLDRAEREESRRGEGHEGIWPTPAASELPQRSDLASFYKPADICACLQLMPPAQHRTNRSRKEGQRSSLTSRRSGARAACSWTPRRSCHCPRAWPPR